MLEHGYANSVLLSSGAKFELGGKCLSEFVEFAGGALQAQQFVVIEIGAGERFLDLLAFLVEPTKQRGQDGGIFLTGVDETIYFQCTTGPCAGPAPFWAVAPGNWPTICCAGFCGPPIPNCSIIG